MASGQCSGQEYLDMVRKAIMVQELYLVDYKKTTTAPNLHHDRFSDHVKVFLATAWPTGHGRLVGRLSAFLILRCVQIQLSMSIMLCSAPSVLIDLFFLLLGYFPHRQRQRPSFCQCCHFDVGLKTRQCCHGCHKPDVKEQQQQQQQQQHGPPWLALPCHCPPWLALLGHGRPWPAMSRPCPAMAGHIYG